MNKEQLEKNYPDLIKYYEEGDCCSHILKARKEIERLNNIINELRKYISSEYYCFDNESLEFKIAKDILNKIQELKGDGSNEKTTDNSI